VVEDSEINLEVARAMLGYHGVTPTVAQDGLAALRLVEAEAFDIIFMDCMMPGIDGYETVRRIRRLEAEQGRAHAATVVALTANVSESDVRRCLEAGMDDFLAKPVTLQTIGRVLADWRAITAPLTGGPSAMSSAARSLCEVFGPTAIPVSAGPESALPPAQQ
jgi:CheY-like chemotaxis protein